MTIQPVIKSNFHIEHWAAYTYDSTMEHHRFRYNIIIFYKYLDRLFGYCSQFGTLSSHRRITNRLAYSNKIPVFISFSIRHDYELWCVAHCEYGWIQCRICNWGISFPFRTSIEKLFAWIGCTNVSKIDKQMFWQLSIWHISSF